MSKLMRAALTGLAIPAILALAACQGATTGSTASPSASPAAATPAPAESEPATSAEPSTSAEASPSGVALNQAILQFEEQSDSGITGGAILTDLGDGELAVTIGVVAIGFAEPMPAHIHEGTCADLDPTPKYPLNDVAAGSSNTVIEVTLDELTADPHAVNIHKSAAEAAVYVACADITQ